MLVVTILPLMKADYAWNHFDLLWQARVKVGYYSETYHRSKNIEFRTFKLRIFLSDNDSAYPRGVLYLLRCL